MKQYETGMRILSFRSANSKFSHTLKGYDLQLSPRKMVPYHDLTVLDF